MSEIESNDWVLVKGKHKTIRLSSFDSEHDFNTQPTRNFHENSVFSRLTIRLIEEKCKNKDGNILKWMCYIIDDDIEYLVNEKLKILKKVPIGSLDCLWNCLYNYLMRSNTIIDEYRDFHQLKEEIYLMDKSKNNKNKNSDHVAMKYFALKYKMELRFSSIDDNVKEIFYGKNLLKSAHFLHIGMDLFLPLESSEYKYYKFSNEEKSLLEGIINIKEDKNEDKLIFAKEVKALKDLNKLLKGLERADSYDFENMKRQGLLYDIYSPEQLNDKKDNIILCELKVNKSHSGLAIPIQNSTNKKLKEITLNNRRNCGFNVFLNDIVYVKIINEKYQTGQVLGVYQSIHKPVNKLYICKVSKNEGNLMIPLDKSFPKIRVDNKPGRNLYKPKMKNENNSKNISVEQKSFKDKERESNRYADNLYFSLFKITGINNLTNKPNFGDCKCIKFSPDTCEYLFVVLYDSWDPHFMYPFGKIVGTLSCQESLKDSLPLIRSICNLNLLDITPKYERELKEIRETHRILDKPHRNLPSDAIVFTIDNKTTKDMDDAISYHREKDQVIIGIHISDVTKYISSTSEMYKQAKDCFCTSYPPKFLGIPPFHIFDERLAADFLSLVPGKPRAVVSVFFKFPDDMMENKNFKLSDIIQPEFSEDVIISKYKLNYDEVSLWLRHSSVPSDVDADLYVALENVYKIARKIRHTRLPYSYFVRSVRECYRDLQTENKFEAELLVEEFMLLANEYVARIIYENCPNSTLLRMQNPVKDREEWLENVYKSSNLNFAGQLKEYCSLLGSSNFNGNSRKEFIVSRNFSNTFSELVKRSDFEKAKTLLQYDEYYNEFYVHITDWFQISSPSYYICSEEGSANMRHFSLNKPLYTHFTSPIRRFTDVVVHRLLKSVIHKISIDDCSLDIDEVCEIANKKGKYNKNFEKLCASYALIEETDKQFCFILDCVCREIKDEGIICAHPLLQGVSSNNQIKFSHLSLDDVPFLLNRNEKISKCNLKWRKIIFSCPPNFNTSTSWNNKFKIDSHLFDSNLPHSAARLFQDIRRSYLPGVALENELNQLCEKFVSSDYSNVVSSDKFSFGEPIIDIELDLFVKNTMRMQFCKYRTNGLTQINPELFIVTPTFHICLIHQNNPCKFFVSGGKLDIKHDDVKESFDSIKEYKEYFEPLIEDEYLIETIKEPSAFTLEKVPIKWICGRSTRTNKFERYGVIKLSYDFCKERNDIFHREMYKLIDRCEYLIASGVSSAGGSLLCLRCKKENWKNYWVGHGHVVSHDLCFINNIIMKIIVFRLTQSDFNLPPQSSENVTFTLDFYPKSIVSIREQMIMNSIDNITLLKEVILGKQTLRENIHNEIIEQILKELKWKQFNSNQNNAIKNALNQKLSLIWGPPGTGKTMVGCYLSFAYAFINRNEDKKAVVLYCGPSNDCINLIASTMMMKFNEKCPKLLRIFGKQQELSDFPLPGHFVKNKPLTVDIQEVSLHFLIRKSGRNAEQLNTFDEVFNQIRNTKKIPANFKVYDAIIAYKNAVKEAKREYISANNFEMILCTTSVTLKNIMKSFNVAQVIIDEAGMCKEPETLIPIAATEKTVQNIVLIGDHKQLRPIIRSKVAGKRGLQISLFERYQKLRPDLVTMLNYQYRMHPSICEFPSSEFYTGRLLTKVSALWAGLRSDHMKVDCPKFEDRRKFQEEIYKNWDGINYKKAVDNYKEILETSNYNAIPNDKWPSKRVIPYKCFRLRNTNYPERIIFIDVIGDEISQSVTTETGNQNSKGNLVEVEVVGYIYRKLIQACHPPRLAPDYITVLTQYKYQQHLLEEKCKSVLSKKTNRPPIVKTVIRSQGSENDYIIFSTVRSMNIEDINSNPTFGWESQHLGFITDLNQINVALTRAKKGLIIIGDSKFNESTKTTFKDIDALSNKVKFKQAEIDSSDDDLDCIENESKLNNVKNFSPGLNYTRYVINNSEMTEESNLDSYLAFKNEMSKTKNLTNDSNVELKSICRKTFCNDEQLSDNDMGCENISKINKEINSNEPKNTNKRKSFQKFNRNSKIFRKNSDNDDSL